ncbi:MAG: hypothetical protein V1848_03535 [Candidatus Magasanikbacteria bacterium]
MFEDQNTSGSGQIPGNLPVGEPEDIFSGNEPVNNEQVSPQGEEIPSAMEAGILRPKESVPQTPVMTTPPFGEGLVGKESYPASFPTPVPSQVPTMQTYEAKEPNFGKVIFIIFFVLLVVGGGAYGAWYYYTNYYATTGVEKEVVEETTTIPPVVEEEIITEETTPPVTQATKEEESAEGTPVGDKDSTLLFGDVVDTDEDGLDDFTENDIGTDPRNWDTDADMLSDSEEHTIWGTDPLNPDSDKDNYMDGQEVRAGFNPMGPGRLTDFLNNEKATTEKTNVTSSI